METIDANRALPPAVAFHPLVSPQLPKEKIGFAEYRYMMTYPRWNRALSWIRAAKAWDNGIGGARLLLELTERYKRRLRRRDYIRSQVQLYLFWLDTLARAGRKDERAELWALLRDRNDLTVRYRADSAAARSQYVVTTGRGYAEINLLWLCRRGRRAA